MTTLVRWNPNRSIRRMHTDIDRLMESFFDTPRVAPPTSWGVPMDVVELDDEYTIIATVPGLKKEDISTSIEEGVLSISGEVRSGFDSAEDGEGDGAENDPVVKYHLRERRFGSFNRKLRLPKDVDVDQIAATQEDGILTISLPKAEAAKPKQITIS